ncbi:MAG: PID-CTERM protein-sorting domain-containing protein [Ekhidna sp.]
MAQGAPPATPIDGGLSLLLAAGGAYGLKKLKDSRK